MRVLLVTGIFPPDIGGPATFVPEMATALWRRGHEVAVVTLSDDLWTHDGFPFHVVRVPRQLPKPWRWIRTVLSVYLLGRKVDVLLVAGLMVETSLAIVLLRKPAIYRVVGDEAWERSSAHGWVTDSFEEFQRKRYGSRVRLTRLIRNWALRRADVIVCPSRYLAECVRKWGIEPHRTKVIPNGLPSSQVKDGWRVPLKTPVKLVTASRLVPLKQIDVVIECMVSLDQVGLVVVGDGPDRSRLEQLAQSLDVADRVYFAGRRSRAGALRIMAACDVFVLCSTHEAFPFSLVEAMSLGLPALVTAVGGVPELLARAGHAVLVEPSREAIAEGISRAVNDLEIYRSLALDARSGVHNAFDSSRFEAEIERLLADTVLYRGSS